MKHPLLHKRVQNIRGDNDYLTYDLITYFSKDIKSTILQSTAQPFIPSKDENALRWDKQIYQYIKTLPENKGWEDVLEEGQTI